MKRIPQEGVTNLVDAKKVIERKRYAALVLETFDRFEREDRADERHEFRETLSAVRQRAKKAF